MNALPFEPGDNEGIVDPNTGRVLDIMHDDETPGDVARLTIIEDGRPLAAITVSRTELIRVLGGAQ